MEKKLRKSPIVTVLYVLAALALVYSCYLVGSTVSYINSYYSAYGMSAEVGETITYVLQSVFQPLMTAVLLFAAAKVLNEVRALNPAYYATDEEIALEKEQKKLAKAAKKDAKADAETEEAAEPIVFEEPKEEAVEEAAEEAVEEKKPAKKPRRKAAKKEEPAEEAKEEVAEEEKAE